MKSALITGSFLDGLDFYGGSRFKRTVKWLNYYIPLKEELGFEEIILLDNKSDSLLMSELKLLFPEIEVIVHDERLHGGDHHKWEYPYVWRHLSFMMTFGLILKKKIIFMESDTYVLSKKFAKHIKELDSGYETVYCPKYSMPEASLQILCPDSAVMAVEWMGNWRDHVGQQTEFTLPFTKVNMDFIGDRYGEDRQPQDRAMDYYVQCQTDMDMVFNIGGFK